jgi:hypothetical protein
VDRDRRTRLGGQPMREEVTRRFVPPLGWPFKFRAATITPSNRHPLFVWNRYPGQIIGFAVRLPDAADTFPPVKHRALSIMWAKPARWWTK